MAELGTIQKAAAAVGMGQPSATQALSQLESLLEMTLFDRHARGVRLTREGALLVPTLQRVLAALEALGLDAAVAKRNASGMVRIAGISAATAAIATPVLPDLCAAQPDLWIQYQEVDAAQIPALCREEAADLLLCRSSTPVPRGYEFQPLRADRLSVYCSPSHPLVRRRRLTLQDCASALWLLPPSGSPPYRSFMQWCTQQAFSPRLAQISTRSLGLSIALVNRLQTLYLGLDSHLQASVANGQLHRLPLVVPYAVDDLGLLLPVKASEAVGRVAAFLTQR
jgi:DNA-binding transcriptional LysR family regulator